MLHRSHLFFHLSAMFIFGVFLSSTVPIYGTILAFLTIFGLALISLSFPNRSGLLFGFLVITFVFGAARFNQVNYEEDRISTAVGQEGVWVGYVYSEAEKKQFQ